MAHASSGSHAGSQCPEEAREPTEYQHLDCVALHATPASRLPRRFFDLLLSALFLLLPSLAFASPIDARAILAESAEHFRAGAAALDTDRDLALRELDAAVAGYERVLADSGIRNGRLYYNVANAHLLKGDLGRAILNYRRAAELIPSDANLAANLAVARQRVATRIDAPAQERVRRALLFWHDETAPRTRFAIFLAANALAWGWLLLRRARPRLIGGVWPAAALAAVAFAMMTSLIIDRRARADDDDAVIVEPQTIGRKGPDAAAYEPSFTEPLHAGVEITIVERRPGWVLVRLADSRETWLSEKSIEPVNPTA